MFNFIPIHFPERSEEAYEALFFFLEVIITIDPILENSLAIANPSPDEPPVMTTTLSNNDEINSAVICSVDFIRI